MLAEARAAGCRFISLSQAQGTRRAPISCSSTPGGMPQFCTRCMNCLGDRVALSPGLQHSGSRAGASGSRQSRLLKAAVREAFWDQCHGSSSLPSFGFPAQPDRSKHKQGQSFLARGGPDPGLARASRTCDRSYTPSPFFKTAGVRPAWPGCPLLPAPRTHTLTHHVGLDIT